MKLLKKIKKADLEQARDRLFELKQAQNEAREEEVAIREWMAEQFHDGEEGAKTVTVDGIKFTVGRPLSRTITAEEAERFCQDHPDLSTEVLKWKPEIKVAAYKLHSGVADEYITTKPGLVTVDFK